MLKLSLIAASLLVTVLASAGTAQAAGTVAAGQNIYASQCAMCHSNQPGGQGIGPSLAGVYGKPAASQAGYAYSSALKAAHLTWNSVTLDKFLAAPQASVPGTKMPYAGLTDAGQRADVIAYLGSIAP